MMEGVYRSIMPHVVVGDTSPSKDFLNHGTDIRKIRDVLELRDPVPNNRVELLVGFRHHFWESHQPKNEAVHRMLGRI
jgi:hypothetical protein